MHPQLARTKARIRDATKPLGEAAVGALTIGLLRATRYFDPVKTANLFGRILRLIGPLTREQRIGRANLTAAFPEKSPAEIETILRGVWDNLGRVAAEFAHIDRLQMFDPDPQEIGDIVYSSEVDKRFRQLRCDGKPALVFAAHLANWELPALIAAKFRLDATVLYREPNIAAVSDAIIQIRKGS